MVSQETYDFVMKYADKLNSAIIFDRDFDLSYFGFKTLERSYLLKINGKVVERPQHLFMRVAVGKSFNQKHSVNIFLRLIGLNYHGWQGII